jgi:SAM-dependent methyltransferase
MKQRSPSSDLVRMVPRRARSPATCYPGFPMAFSVACGLMLVLQVLLTMELAYAWNNLPPKKSSSNTNNKNIEISRRDAVLIAGGGLLYGKVASGVLGRLADRNGGVRPSAHEDRVKQTFLAAAQQISDVAGNNHGPQIISEKSLKGQSLLRVLEVGMGTACLSLQRGYYQDTMNYLQTPITGEGPTASPYTGMSLTGIDLDVPKPQQLERGRVAFVKQINAATNSSSISDNNSNGIDENSSLPALINWSFDMVQGSAESMPFEDASFDMVTTSFVLCSVENQQKVLTEIKRILRPGGTFGYVEHVAVTPADDRPFFEWQQKTLDPLQQRVAHNCHLHRNTQDAIENVFDGPSNIVQQERFYVDDMWPVCCQLEGVARKT